MFFHSIYSYSRSISCPAVWVGDEWFIEGHLTFLPRKPTGQNISVDLSILAGRAVAMPLLLLFHTTCIHSKSEPHDPNGAAKKLNFPQIICHEMTPGFTHFFRNFFLTEKAIPQTFSLLKCMDEISNLNQCWIWFSSQERKAELERREKEEEEREKEETRREEEFSKVDFMMKWWKMRALIGWQRVQNSLKGLFKSSTYKLLL